MKRKSFSRLLFEIFNAIFMSVLMLITLYPLLYVIFASMSDANELLKHGGKLLYKPLEFTLAAYKLAFKDNSIVTGYKNTSIILVIGVPISMYLSAVGAYFLSRKDVMFKKIITKLIMFTMFFSGGLIPFYLTVRDLKMIDSLWSLILPTAINTYNMIILRTAFEGLPPGLEESARMDGAGHMTVLFKIIIPLSKATLAVIALYYGVGVWNSWFNASIFLQRGNAKWPLQLVLRQILIQNDTASMTAGTDLGDMERVAESIKYAVIVIATMPVLCIYPFIQKYFTKGVMIGAVKG
jgi:putative aldouronate transport system permease protein